MRSALPDPGAGWRRVPPEALHVTLAFLGQVESSEAVCAAVGPALRPVGRLSLSGAVLLPPRRPRVMAVRVEGEIGELQACVSRALAGAGLYTPEKRPFLAHVTIGRARAEASSDLPEVPASAFMAPSVTVYRSLLSPRGARYEVVCRFPLLAAGSDPA